MASMSHHPPSAPGLTPQIPELKTVCSVLRRARTWVWVIGFVRKVREHLLAVAIASGFRKEHADDWLPCACPNCSPPASNLRFAHADWALRYFRISRARSGLPTAYNIAVRGARHIATSAMLRANIARP